MVITVSDGDGVAVSGATVSVEEKADTGTVTVTTVDSEQNPLEHSGVVLSTEPIDFSSQDDTGFVAYGLTGSDGTVTLNLWDITTHQPTQDTDVPYGTYYFGGFNGDGGVKTYTGTLVVDGDEDVTITLTGQQTNTGTVTVTCQDSSENKLENAFVSISEGEETPPIAVGLTDSNGETTLETPDAEQMPSGTVADVPYGNYLLFGNYSDESTGTDYSYSGELTVDGDETVTITLTQE